MNDLIKGGLITPLLHLVEEIVRSGGNEYLADLVQGADHIIDTVFIQFPENVIK